MDFKKIAEEVFRTFALKEGNKHIASSCGLEGVLKRMDRYKFGNDLDVGVSIGTVPYVLSENAKSKPGEKLYYCGFEENDFCIGGFKKKRIDRAPNFKIDHRCQRATDSPKFLGFVIVDVDDPTFVAKDLDAQRRGTAKRKNRAAFSSSN